LFKQPDSNDIEGRLRVSVSWPGQIIGIVLARRRLPENSNDGLLRHLSGAAWRLKVLGHFYRQFDKGPRCSRLVSPFSLHQNSSALQALLVRLDSDQLLVSQGDGGRQQGRERGPAVWIEGGVIATVALQRRYLDPRCQRINACRATQPAKR